MKIVFFKIFLLTNLFVNAQAMYYENNYKYLIEAVININQNYYTKDLNFLTEKALLNCLKNKLDFKIEIKKHTKKSIIFKYKDEKYEIDEAYRYTELIRFLKAIKQDLMKNILLNGVNIRYDAYITNLIVSSLDSTNDFNYETYRGFYVLNQRINFKFDSTQKQLFVKNINFKNITDSIKIGAGNEILDINGIKSKYLTNALIHHLFNYHDAVSIRYLQNAEEKIEILYLKQEKKVVDDNKDMFKSSEVNFFVDSGYVVIRNDIFFDYSFRNIISFVKEYNPKGIIIDLRYSEGGSFYNIKKFCENFTQKNTLLFLFNKTYETDSLITEIEGELLKAPMAILINEKTCSGAEICAYTLKLNSKALLIGTQTKGSGDVYFYNYIVNNQAINEFVCGYKIRSGEILMNDKVPLNNNKILPDIFYDKEDIIKFAQKCLKNNARK